MIKKPFTFNVDQETIACTILSNNDTSIPPKFVFLHGAGTSTKEVVYSIAAPILNVGMNILALDFSGHGASTGELKKSSLSKRVNEASHVIKNFAAEEPLIICGVSMGGTVAIKLLESFKVETLMLFCPALYDRNAYDVLFSEGFTEIIRANESWRNTDMLAPLEAYQQKLLLVMGDKDDVIPPGVIELIMRHTPHTKKKELYTIPNCPHRVNYWIVDQPLEQEQLHSKMFEYISYPA